MLNKWKSKRELIKAFKFYRKEYQKAYTHYNKVFREEFPKKNFKAIDEAYDNMEKIEMIVKSLGYILHTNFFVSIIHDGCWVSTYYDLYKDEAKKYLEELNSSHNKDIIYTDFSVLESWDIGQRALNTLSQIEGTVIFDISTQKMYMSDGKKFVEMC